MEGKGKELRGSGCGSGFGRRGGVGEDFISNTLYLIYIPGAQDWILPVSICKA